MKNFIIIGAISMALFSCGNSEKEDNTEALTYQGRIVLNDTTAVYFNASIDGETTHHI